MRVVKKPISEIDFDPANVRKHSERNLEAIRGSLRRFGQQKPIVVCKDTGTVLAGNGTLAAAKELGWTTIGVIETKLKGTEAVAFAIADNRTAELASWDTELLGAVSTALKDDGVELDAIGFTDEELSDVLAGGFSWDSDIERVDAVEPNSGPAPARMTIIFEERDRPQLREAVTNLLDSLGLENASIS